VDWATRTKVGRGGWSSTDFNARGERLTHSSKFGGSSEGFKETGAKEGSGGEKDPGPAVFTGAGSFFAYSKERRVKTFRPENLSLPHAGLGREESGGSGKKKSTHLGTGPHSSARVDLRLRKDRMHIRESDRPSESLSRLIGFEKGDGR